LEIIVIALIMTHLLIHVFDFVGISI
jgi:hypothetical protein